MRERTSLDNQIKAVSEIATESDDLIELIAMADEEGDEASKVEAEGLLARLATRAAKAEAEALLSGEADGNDCYVEVHPGAGGTESNDWAAMLLRMYVRWAGANDYKVEVIEEQPGDEAGIKSGDGPRQRL